MTYLYVYLTLVIITYFLLLISQTAHDKEIQIFGNTIPSLMWPIVYAIALGMILKKVRK